MGGDICQTEYLIKRKQINTYEEFLLLCNKKTKARLIIEMHTFNCSTGEAESRRSLKFESKLLYIASPNPERATQGDSVAKNIKSRYTNGQ